jgi:two-component system, NarL family, sensor histidine kinase DevS
VTLHQIDTTPQTDLADRAHARLESLMRANRAIVAELSLETLLSLVVESAREVLGAEYAALGLIRPDGSVQQVIYSGVDEATLARLRELTTGSGPLAHLVDRAVDDAEPARLRPLGDGALLTGPSSGQPLVTSLIAVAIHSSSTVYGNLYLGNRLDGQSFSHEDERLAVALAATAGIAIENARLYEESRRRQQWLEASTEISQRLLAGADTATDALSGIAASVQRLAGADLVSVVLPVPGTSDMLQVAVAAGAAAPAVTGLQYQVHDSIAWQAMQSGRGLVVSDAERREGVYLHVRGIVPAKQVMAIPLQAEGPPHGAIVVVRSTDEVFSPGDLEMAEGFANQATLALELAEARQDRHRLAVLEDRARIARDLHDHVVQKLFAVGLTIQGTTGAVPEPGLRDRLAGTVRDLDDTIRSIRTAIFQLQEPRSPLASARSRVRSVLADLTPTLGFGPIAQFEGPLDTMLDEGLAAEVELVLRASLADIAEHARASTVTVNLTTDGRELRATVTDDGARDRRGRLAELHRRAERRGGHVETQCSAEGRVLRWTVPI